MASKSRLYGGGDAWSPNGVIPWGYNQETSLVWYADAGVALTRMYAYEFSDAIGMSAGLTRLLFSPLWSDILNPAADLIGISLTQPLKVFGFTEQLYPSALLTNLSLRPVVSIYDDWPNEFMTAGADAISIQLKEVVIAYGNYPPERITPSAQLLGVTLT